MFVGVLASAHVYQVIKGIHFKVGGEFVDFGEPPSRYSDRPSTALDYEANWRPGSQFLLSGGDDWEEEEAHERRRQANEDALLGKARSAELGGERARALRLYREALSRKFGDVGFVRGRIELLEAIGDRPVDRLGAYLSITGPGNKPPAQWPTSSDPTLSSFLAYEEAVATPGDGTTRGRKLVAVAERYPSSPRAPAALIMASRTLTQGEKSWYAPADLRVAHRAIDRLQKRYPDSRFVWAAHGERGRIAFVQKRYGEALRHYDRQLRLAKNGDERDKALTSILMAEDAWGRRDRVAVVCLRLIRLGGGGYMVRRLDQALSFFDAKDAARFGQTLRRDPALLDEYLEYRVDFTEPTKDLYRFSTTPGIKSLALARLASVALKFKDAKRARRYADRALRLSDEKDAHALATFTLATLDRRAGRKSASRAKYAAIVRRWPKSYLAGGARENLTLLNEQLDDLGAALDQYGALGYREDFAYMIDVRMTSGQLARYIATRPRHPQRPTLIYTLGMRYLREGKWSQAETSFDRLDADQRRRFASMRGNYIGDEKTQDPMETLKALQRLDLNVRRAKGRNAKAAALFAMGDYYYRHGNLLLYSPPAWQGLRSVVISHSWNYAVARPEDDRALKRHHGEHEAISHALRLYRRVVKEYPETPIAPRAAYWGACAANRLADFANYWRWENRDASLTGEAVRLMKFAERSKDPALAKKARKYHGVFRKEYTANRMAFAKEKAPARRYRGGWE